MSENKPSLRLLSRELEQLWAEITLQDGEITPEQEERLNELMPSYDQKVRGTLIVLRRFDSEEMTLESDIAELQKAVKRVRARREWLESYLGECTQYKPWTDHYTSLSLKWRPSVVTIIDPQKVEALYKARPDLVKVLTRYSPQKTLIKKYLTSHPDQSLDGVVLQPKQNPQIRPATEAVGVYRADGELLGLDEEGTDDPI